MQVFVQGQKRSRPEYWTRLKVIRERLMLASKARNTTNAYTHAWKVFSRWCADTGCTAEPATSETLAQFVTWCLYERQPRCYRLNTVIVALSAITQRHLEHDLPPPVSDEVRTLVRNARRDLREKRGGKDALPPKLLRRVCGVFSDGSVHGIRDRAMILMQFAAGWRCSEIVSVDRADVRFTAKGYIVTLGASKTDQDGSEGRIVGVEYGDHPLTCPVRALKEWLQQRGKWPGPLFCPVSTGGAILRRRIVGDTINERLKAALEKLGAAKGRYGSHSLRSGMVTTAIEQGASETLIMLRTGHKSLDSMRRYVRSAKAFRANPLKGVL